MPKKRAPQMLIDPQGREIPADMIRPDLVARDKAVRAIMARGVKLSEHIAAEKAKMLEELQKYLASLEAANGAPLGNEAEIKSFDGKMTITRSSYDRIEFGPELQQAKSLIDECVIRWSEGSNANLKAVVMDAFKVDKKGKLPVGSILRLRNYKIEDAAWATAMDLIGLAMNVVESRSYLGLWVEDETGKKQAVKLNFSSL